MNATELVFRRRNIRAFIKADPVMVSFIRRLKVPTPAGGWKWGPNLPPLAPQEGRIVDSKRRYADVHVNTEAGPIDLWPYILVGYHDMDIQEEDVFFVNDEKYTVKSIKAERLERIAAALEYHGA